MARDVFNVTRTDRDGPAIDEAQQPLRQLLAPVSAVPAEATPGQPVPRPVTTPGSRAATTTPAGGAGSAAGVGAGARADRPRGAGGKAPEEARPSGGITAVPARVPGDLYEAALHLVKGVGRPSWGQLVAWTCQDHPDQVRAEVARQAAAAVGSRRPRGQNRPGAAGVQVTARLSADELEVLEQTRASCTDPGESPPTRTAVLVAAVTVAAATDG